MRIGIISSGTYHDQIPPIYGGGIQKYVWNLARGLTKLNHEIHIFTNRQPNQLNEELNNGIYIHRVPQIIKSKLISTSLFGLLSVYRILRVQKQFGKFNILHAQSRVSACVLRLFFSRVPFVITVHNWDVSLTSPGAFHPILVYAFLLFVEKWVYLHSNKIISPTRFFQSILLSRYNLRPSELLTISNMVDFPMKEKKHEEIPSQIKRIGTQPFLIFIGRLEKEKQIEKLLHNFNEITKHEKNLQLVIVGEGSLRNPLEKTKDDLNLMDKVHFTGKLHESQLVPLLKLAKALVLPSKFEIMPMVILEAWAAECPVVAKKFYGVQTLITHKKTGLLYEKENELPPLVHELLTNESLRNNLIGETRIQLKTKFASVRVTKKVAAVYKDLLKRCNQ